MRRSTIYFAATAMVFMCVTTAWTQLYSEDFESLDIGDPISDLPGWSGAMLAVSPAELGGNIGVGTSTTGVSHGANLDLLGEGLQPSPTFPSYELRADVYL